jgi:lysyl endopeptidase
MSNSFFLSAHKTATLLALCVGLTACGGSGSSPGAAPAGVVASSATSAVAASAPLAVRVDGAVKPDNLPGEVKRSTRRSASSVPLSTAVALEPVPGQRVEALRQQSKKKNEQEPRALQVGIARDLTSLNRESAMSSALRWYPTSGKGFVAAVAITSPGAHQIRLGILVLADRVHTT